MLVGRAWIPDLGPSLILVKGQVAFDLSSVAPTSCQLLELDDPLAAILAHVSTASPLIDLATVRVDGPDGFVMRGSSFPLDLVAQTIGPCHQYPDGFMLFLGTMFSPTEDRFEPGQGFTHVIGDIASVSAAALGRLVNRVNRADLIAPWTVGTGALMRNLAQRGLI